MGEIGIPRREFLFVLPFWEVRRIMRGYQRRHRDLWSAVRWHAYHIMYVMPYCDLKSNGYHNPTDLMPLPWDKKEKPNLPSEEEIRQMQEDMKTFNPWKK